MRKRQRKKNFKKMMKVVELGIHRFLRSSMLSMDGVEARQRMIDKIKPNPYVIDVCGDPNDPTKINVHMKLPIPRIHFDMTASKHGVDFNTEGDRDEQGRKSESVKACDGTEFLFEEVSDHGSDPLEQGGSE
jgi:hypothetical protein